MFIRYSDSLTDATLPAMALYVFRKVIQNHLSDPHFVGRNVFLAFTDNKKDWLRKQQWRTDTELTQYPYVFGTLSSITTDVERSAVANPKMALKRTGTGIVVSANSNAEIMKNFIIDFQFEVSLHYLTDDPLAAISFANDVLLMNKADLFTSKINDSYGPRLVEITCDNQVTIPTAPLEDATAPGVIDLEIPFRVRFKSGSQKFVPKINNQGTVDLEMRLPGE